MAGAGVWNSRMNRSEVREEQAVPGRAKSETRAAGCPPAVESPRYGHQNCKRDETTARCAVFASQHRRPRGAEAISPIVITLRYSIFASI